MVVVEYLDQPIAWPIDEASQDRCILYLPVRSYALWSSMKKGMEEKSLLILNREDELPGLIRVSVYMNPTCCFFREDPDPCRVTRN